MAKRRGKTQHIEFKVNEILAKDGVDIVNVDNTRMHILTSLDKLKRRFPNGKSWAHRVINTANSAFFNSATLISQNKGQGCRRHKHPDCDEFWVILSGRMRVEAGEGAGTERIEVSAGDIVYLKKGTGHRLTVISDNPGVRLSVSVEAMRNTYF
jgi:mannose-6-phosphate isomerase-like protein (cupin superfamily)